MKDTEIMQAFAKGMGFRGRFWFLFAGICGIVLPGFTLYVVLKGIAQGVDDAQIQDLFKDLRDDAAK
jgi:hypothetical protein